MVGVCALAKPSHTMDDQDAEDDCDDDSACDDDTMMISHDTTTKNDQTGP